MLLLTSYTKGKMVQMSTTHQIRRNELPARRWVSRAVVIEFLGSRRELERLEAEQLISREYPGGRKYAMYRTAQVRAAVDQD